MGGFILLILFAAWLQSMLKLTLLPRWIRWIILAAAMLPVFFFKDRLASCNLQMIEEFLSNGDNLRDLCALVVIQELLALVIGLSLLKERELGIRVHKWKYLALLPSLLLPVGAMYAEALAFNTILRYSFTQIMWGVGVLLVLFSAGGCELFACLRRTMLDKISAAMTATWMLLLLAVFMPSAVEGRLSPGDGLPTEDWLRNLAILGILTLLTAFSAVGFQLYRNYKEKKRKCVILPRF